MGTTNQHQVSSKQAKKLAEEARKIHHGETEHRNIRGQASREETEALLDEGIDILPLPMPAGLKEPLQ